MYIKLLVFIFVLVQWCECSQVLVVFPLPGRSHGILGESICRIILESGHQVTYISPFFDGKPPANLTWIDITSVYDDTLEKERSKLMDPTSPRKRSLSRWMFLGPSMIGKVLAHPEVKSMLTDSSVKFDAVIVEWMFSNLFAPLASLFECPLIWFSSTSPHWLLLGLMDTPSNPAYAVDFQSRNMPTPPLSLLDRVDQLYMFFYQGLLTYYVQKTVEEPAYKSIYGPGFQTRGRAIPDYESVIYNASLLLMNSHPPLSPPIAMPQNAKFVGGHHFSFPPKPLPEDLERRMSESKHGVILFSMGSHVKSRDFPEDIRRKLVQFFGELDQLVVWKFEEVLQDLPSNLLVIDWAPQFSILHHPNTVLFISHGGLLSTMEATQTGMPMVGMPMFGDQFLNVDGMVSRGCGVRVDFSAHFVKDLRKAVKEVIGNKRYKENARQAQLTFGQRLISAKTELAHWVQFVMASGGAPHLRSPALLLPWYQRLHLDIAVIFLATIILVCVFIRNKLFGKKVNLVKRRN